MITCSYASTDILIIIIPNKFQTFQLLRKEAKNTFIAAKSTKWNSGNFGSSLVDNSSGEKNLEYDLELGTWNLDCVLAWLLLVESETR